MDAVITWVDGSDPALATRRARYLKDPQGPGAAPTRFASVDEIVWCILSILRFAPFFENIYIVTDRQTPPVFDAIRRHFPDRIDRVKVVDHSEILRDYKEFLPTFNSMSISMGLHHIPGLNEHFVYFNDDFMLVSPLRPADFFDKGRPVLRGGWMGRALDMTEALRTCLDRARRLPETRRRFSSKRWMLHAARLAGHPGRTFIATHAPYPLRRSTLLAFERANPQAWRENLRHRFRAPDQFVYEALANHLELAAGNAIVKDRKALVYIRANRISPKRLRQKLARVEANDTVKFLCIQNLDEVPPAMRSEITGWLDRWIIAPLETPDSGACT